MVDLRQLHYAVVVAEEGQMTRAAARLHIAQPALSQAIAKLEIELGVQLFERHARGVNPTEAGTAFFEKAVRALTAVEEAEEIPRELVDGLVRLVIGFPSAAGPIARAVLRPFMRAHAGIEVRTRHLSPGERLVELKRGSVDAELAFPPPGDPELDERVVAASPRFVLLGEHHPLAGAGSLTFAQIEDETLPGRETGVTSRWAQDAYLMKYRRRPPRLASEMPTSLDELWTLLSRRRVVAILPDFMVPAAQGDGVEAIPITDVDPLHVCLCVRRGDDRPLVRQLLDTPPALES